MTSPPALSPLPRGPRAALALCAAAALSCLLLGPSRLEAFEEAPSPPEGWEATAAPVIAAPPGSGAPRAPACCQASQECCVMQALIDSGKGVPVKQIADIDVASLPELSVQVGEGEAGVAGAPGVKIIDGRGGPPPWPEGPKGEIRLMPPGSFGELSWSGEANTEPFFAAPSLRSMGYGPTRTVRASDRESRGKALLAGKVSYVSLSPGEGGTATIDRVVGELSAAPSLSVARWEHAQAASIAGGLGWAYRSKQGNEETVTVILPEVVLGPRSPSTKLEGGFFPSRFSRSWSYTTYTLPIMPGRSGFAAFELFDHQARRFLPRPPGSTAPLAGSIVITTSQTSAEPSPRVRVLFLGK